MTDRPEGNIFIYCDDPSHAKHVAVTNFYPVHGSPGHWNERYASRAARGDKQSGQTIVDDAPLREGSRARQQKGRDVRSRYLLTCRKCGGGRAVPAREENLFAVLDALASKGQSKVALAQVAANL